MNWFKLDKSLTDKLKKASSVDFKFDPNPGKYRLLASIEHAAQKKPALHFSPILKYCLITACLLLFVSGTFVFAANSQPGDTLFSLNKIGENIILNLPLSDLQKAEVQEQIVTKRLEALDRVQAKTETVKTQLDARKLETVKESDETLSAAIENISKNKQKLEAAGNTQGAEKLGTVLDRLQAKVADREQTIQKIEDETADEPSKTKIRQHLRQIKKSREKAQLEIRRSGRNSPEKLDDRKSDKILDDTPDDKP